MTKQCCQRPLTKIIKVGTFEAGIIGFEAIMNEQAESTWSNEPELASQLLSRARNHGNYISPATEELYKAALSKEFRAFMGRGGK